MLAQASWCTSQSRERRRGSTAPSAANARYYSYRLTAIIVARFMLDLQRVKQRMEDPSLVDGVSSISFSDDMLGSIACTVRSKFNGWSESGVTESDDGVMELEHTRYRAA